MPLTLAVLWITGAQNTAHAYSIESAQGVGCHENITADALRMVRGELDTAEPISPSDNEQALIDDLQFVPPNDMFDLGGVTLMIAVRDNDLKGRGAKDLTELGAVHGDPAGQREHCLRHPDQVEPGGSEAAIADCREFIRTRFMEALDGLDANGNVDPGKRVVLRVHLGLRNGVDADLPVFYVRMGQALHTVEDSFTHTYRTADAKKITAVMNWVNFVEGNHDPAVNGPAHSADMDLCENIDDYRDAKKQQALMAVTELLRAALDPNKSRERKLADADAILDEYMSYEPGCTAANAWCNAPEAAYADSSSCACRETAGPSANLFWFFILLGAAIVIRTRNRYSLMARASLLVLACTYFPTSALAQDETVTSTTGPKPTVDDEGVPLTPAEQAAIPAPKTKPVAEPGSHDPNDTTYGIYAAFSVSPDKTALAGTLAGRMRLSKSWTIGIDAEWNPWINMSTTKVRAGTANLYATAIFRIPLAYEDFNLRVTANLGTSYLLTSLYGAPSGSIGLYWGIAPLGLEWKLSRYFYLIVNPLNFAMPIPQLDGVPLTYPQYRFTIGLELDV